MSHPLSKRRGGVLCHLTSLPNHDGHGPLGPAAERFVDFLSDAGLQIWQLLPLNPPDAYGSPYQSESLFALSPALANLPTQSDARAATLRQFATMDPRSLADFRIANATWLDDYALFHVARNVHGGRWQEWPRAISRREPAALASFTRANHAAIEMLEIEQWQLHVQWTAVRNMANARGILLLGDLPLYPALDSADVWAAQHAFALDQDGWPSHVGGVPPDYFSAVGQLWGNPLYDWDASARDGFAWWVARVARQLALFDVVRLDHFRGLEAFWAVPADAASAASGSWVPGPGRALLDVLAAKFDPLPLVAEDLGTITAAVAALRDTYSLPGMRVFQFAFSGDSNNPHLPERYPRCAVAYTGTHDNDTTLGWYGSLSDSVRARVDAVAGPGRSPWPMIEQVFGSAADTAIVPLQDFLGLGSDARMNTPGTRSGNWAWRLADGQIEATLARRIRNLVMRSGRD